MIHSTALVSPNAKVGNNAKIGAYTIVHDNVVIGDNVNIGSHCEIGVASKLSDGGPLVIGANSLIRSHSVFYEGSIFGDGLTTGHRVTVREMTRAGAGLQIGTLCDIQGHCLIGEYVRFHSNVHIGQKSKIGNYVWIFPYVVLTNDPHPPSNILLGCTVEDFAVIATMAVVLPGVVVGTKSLVAAHALVNKDVPAGQVVAGVPGKVICATEKIPLQDGSGKAAYPWTTHFHRGYPEHVLHKWQENASNE